MTALVASFALVTVIAALLLLLAGFALGVAAAGRAYWLMGERRVVLRLIGLGLTEPAVTIGLLLVFWLAAPPADMLRTVLPLAWALAVLLALAGGLRLREPEARAAGHGALRLLLLRWLWLGVLVSGVFGAFVVVGIAVGTLLLAGSLWWAWRTQQRLVTT